MKKVRLIILTSILSGVLISCSTTRQNTSAYSYEQKMEQSSSNLLLVSNNDKYYDVERVEKKILFSAFLSLAVEVPDTANSHIEKIAKKYNGYVNEIGTYRTIIRVKSENLNDAIKEISELGKVQNKSLSGQDVTEEYLDYKIRLENAERSRERYLELLSKAENVEAALKVEKELERLNETIDLLKGKMNRIDHLSEFSTITINLKEKKKPGLLGYIGIGIYHSVKWLFVRN
jgi:uncharacterized protein involved in tolerance to divalent cations